LGWRAYLCGDSEPVIALQFSHNLSSDVETGNDEEGAEGCDGPAYGDCVRTFVLGGPFGRALWWVGHPGQKKNERLFQLMDTASDERKEKKFKSSQNRRHCSQL